MGRNKLLRFLYLAVILVAGWVVVNSQPVDQYVSTVKQDSELLTVEKSQDLEEKIKELAEKYDETPENARMDPVWKAIPGYNGRKLDIKATLEKIEDNRNISRDKLVFRETEPEIQLDDLEPAPIYRGNPHKPMISFMINVAWGNEYIPDILKILEDYEIKTTFFFDGSWLKKNPELGRKIVDEGHEIGNHAYSHPNMSQLSEASATDQIVKTNRVILNTLNVKANLFAPPSGDFNQRTVLIADRLGMKTILWTLDTVDWKKPRPESIVQRLVPQLDNGVLILMHPTKSSMEALPQLIEAARKKGLIPGTVSDVLSSKRVDLVE